MNPPPFRSVSPFVSPPSEVRAVRFYRRLSFVANELFFVNGKKTKQ